MKRSDAAPQNRLLKVNGTKLIGIKEEKNKPLKLKLFYKFLEPDENNPVEKLMWIVAIETHEQRTLMEVAFSKEDLLKVIEDMGNYEKEKVLS